jgi:hypothetical protein
MLTDIVCLSGVSLDSTTHLMHINPNVPQLAHLGTKSTTFLKHHAGHGRTDLSAIQNLPAESGWTAEHAFATGQEPWEAKCILVAPTAFRTAMSKMQTTNQLQMPADDIADSANEPPMPAILPVQSPPLHGEHPPQLTPQLPAATQLPAAAPAPGSEFEEGDLFTLKSNTKVTSFGTCWVARQEFGEPDATSGDIYITQGPNNSDRIFMIPTSTEVTLLANVQLEFLAYVSPSAVKVKPTLGFQHTISRIGKHDAKDPSVNTLHKNRIKAYNSGAQPAHA